MMQMKQSLVRTESDHFWSDMRIHVAVMFDESEETRAHEARWIRRLHQTPESRKVENAPSFRFFMLTRDESETLTITADGVVRALCHSKA